MEKLEDSIPVGTALSDLESRIASQGYPVRHRYQGFWNVDVKTVHEGEFVDTVIRMQFVLSEDRTVSRIRSLGYQLAARETPKIREPLSPVCADA